jgi:cytochrome c oxidase cbb3-type subunit 2
MKISGIGLHKKLEENTGLLIFGILFVSSIGGLVQVLPSLFQESLKTPTETTKPYGAVQLTGRYGPYTRAGESVYDRPFLWGSKRTGPDLYRVGGKYSDLWHRLHLIDPRSVVSNSIMPAYPWLAERAANADDDIQLKMRVLRKLGHPYTDDEIEAAPAALQGLSEIDALIAYLQVLGTSRNPGDTP